MLINLFGHVIDRDDEDELLALELWNTPRKEMYNLYNWATLFSLIREYEPGVLISIRGGDGLDVTLLSRWGEDCDELALCRIRNGNMIAYDGPISLDDIKVRSGYNDILIRDIRIVLEESDDERVGSWLY